MRPDLFDEVDLIIQKDIVLLRKQCLSVSNEDIFIEGDKEFVFVNL